MGSQAETDSPLHLCFCSRIPLSADMRRNAQLPRLLAMELPFLQGRRMAGGTASLANPAHPV